MAMVKYVTGSENSSIGRRIEEMYPGGPWFPLYEQIKALMTLGIWTPATLTMNAVAECWVKIFLDETEGGTWQAFLNRMKTKEPHPPESWFEAFREMRKISLRNEISHGHPYKINSIDEEKSRHAFFIFDECIRKELFDIRTSETPGAVWVKYPQMWPLSEDGRQIDVVLRRPYVGEP